MRRPNIASRVPFFIAVAISATCLYGQTTSEPNTITGEVISQQQPTPPQPDGYDGPVATGIVFEDVNTDGKYGNGDMLFSGVKVSNGKDIVETDSSGKYELPLQEDSVIFVIKPSGYRTPLNDDNLPKFFYIHKPEGSPALQFPGSQPTGEIPRSVDFPLYRQNEPSSFQVILFGDPQPRNVTEVDYITHDVVAELVGTTSASFGVTLGDIAFDNLETFAPLNRSIAMIGIPWYNVIGNHDINLDATSRKHINETFEETYGPTYFSFDYGQVHFVLLDNIDWQIPPEEKPRYLANFGKRQMDWLRKDLAMIPKSQMVVLLMHVPIMQTKDSQDLYRLIEDRPVCMSVSAHQHFHQHLFLGEKDGWNGKQPHHHVINVTVSGSWWSGQKDERGIPHTMMADGAPNGYSIMTFDQNGYKMDFKAAGRPAAEQLRIMMDYAIDANVSGESGVWVNIYNGSEKSTARMKIEGSNEWIELQREVAVDPDFARTWESEQSITPIPEPKLTKPQLSSHLWTAKLPARLSPGLHQLNVETTDMHGRKFVAKRSFRVTGELTSVAEQQTLPTTESTQSGKKLNGQKD